MLNQKNSAFSLKTSVKALVFSLLLAGSSVFAQDNQEVPSDKEQDRAETNISALKAGIDFRKFNLRNVPTGRGGNTKEADLIAGTVGISAYTDRPRPLYLEGSVYLNFSQQRFDLMMGYQILMGRLNQYKLIPLVGYAGDSVTLKRDSYKMTSNPVTVGTHTYTDILSFVTEVSGYNGGPFLGLKTQFPLGKNMSFFLTPKIHFDRFSYEYFDGCQGRYCYNAPESISQKIDGGTALGGSVLSGISYNFSPYAAFKIEAGYKQSVRNDDSQILSQWATLRTSLDVRF